MSRSFIFVSFVGLLCLFFLTAPARAATLVQLPLIPTHSYPIDSKTNIAYNTEFGFGAFSGTVTHTVYSSERVLSEKVTLHTGLTPYMQTETVLDTSLPPYIGPEIYQFVVPSDPVLQPLSTAFYPQVGTINGGPLNHGSGNISINGFVPSELWLSTSQTGSILTVDLTWYGSWDPALVPFPDMPDLVYSVETPLMALPEPASLGILALGACILLARRRPHWFN